MKKRLLSLLLCLVMVFSLMPFGASAQVYPITDESVVVEIRFHDTDGTVSTQRVNNVGGSVAEGAIYDPGCTVGANQVFAGWAIDSASATPGSVEAIRSYVNTNFNRLTADGLDVYAVTNAVRYLVYYDETGRVLKTVSATVTGNTDPSVTVDQSYVPQDSDKNFTGWTTVEGGNTVQYENDDSITLTTAETKLYPVSKTGYWLSFGGNIENNDDDSTAATYTAPMFFGEDDPTEAPTDPTRPGYTFKGWYVDAETMQTPYVFGQKLTKNDKVFAKWEATGTVKYQVIFWKQRTTDAPNTADADKTYDYFAEISEERSAAAGSMVKVTDTDKQMARAAEPNIVTGAENWHFFTYNGTRTNENEVPVKGDGTTVLNVYYDRVPITYQFVDEDGDLYDLVREPEEGETATHYYYDDPYETGYYLVGYGPLAGQNPASLNSAGVQLYRSGSSSSDTTPTDKYYSSTTSSSGWTTYLTSYSYGSNTLSQNNDRYWYYRTSSLFSSSYYFLYAPYTNRSGYYEVGTGPDTTETGTYVLEPTSFTGLYGAQFTKWPYPGDGQVWQNGETTFPLPLTVFDPETVEEGKTDTTITWTLTESSSGADLIVYKQKTDGNWEYTTDNEIARAKIGYGGGYDAHTWTPTETYSGFTLNAYRTSTTGQWNENVTPFTTLSDYGDHLELRYSRNQYNFNYQSNGRTIAPAAGSKVYYEASLEGFATFEPTNGPEGTFFDGWYADPGFETKFDFNSTMPDHDVMVYAKWTPKQYRVVLDTDGGTFSTQSQQATFDLGYLAQINGGNEVSATKADHQLVGWYLPDGTRFNFADTLLTDAIAEDFETDENPAVKGKVTLTAHWRKVLTGNETLMVRYDAKDGTINDEKTYNDPRSYADYAQAIAHAAAAPGVPGQNFSYWQVMQYTENGFVEKTVDGELVKVNPGETFEVRLNDAQKDGNTYYVYLEARYASAGKTHVNWVANNGDGMDYKASENTAINSEIAIESANTFSYPDHVFLGWAKLNEYDATSAPDGMKYDETNGWDQQPALTADDLWLIWDETAGENGAFRVNTGDKPIARAIGADQIKPYEVLYAVWEQYESNDVKLMDYGVTGTIATDVQAGSLKGDPGFNLDANGKLTFKYAAADTAFAESQKTQGTKVVTNYTAWDYDYTGIAGAKTATYRDANGALHKVTVIAASSAYFDDSLNGKTKETLDGSGVLSTAVDHNAKSTDESQSTRITIKFKGTGIDVYCTSASNSGSVSYSLDGKGGVVVNKNADNATFYNAPTISERGKIYGEHTLVINCGKSAGYQLDGIRIYGATEDTTQATELTAKYQNLRTILKTDIVTDQNDVDGAVYVPGEGNGDGKDYAKGTKNEIMLSPGHGVAFKVTGAQSIYIGMASATGAEVTAKVSYGVTEGENVAKEYTFSNTIHTFYEVKPTNDGYVYIQSDKSNPAGSLISISDVKYIPEPSRMVTFSFNRGLMNYVSNFNALPLASEVVETTPDPTPAVDPDPTPNADPEPSPSADLEPTPSPDPTPTNSFTSIVRQLFSSFMQSLFGSMSRLFGR